MVTGHDASAGEPLIALDSWRRRRFGTSRPKSGEPAGPAVVAHPGWLYAAFWLGVGSVVLLAVGQATLGLVDFRAIRFSVMTSSFVPAGRDEVPGVVDRGMVPMWLALGASWAAVVPAWLGVVPRRPVRWWSRGGLAALGLLVVIGMVAVARDMALGYDGVSTPSLPFGGFRAVACTVLVAIVVAGLAVRFWQRRPGMLPALLTGWAMLLLVVVLLAWVDGSAWKEWLDSYPWLAWNCC